MKKLLILVVIYSLQVNHIHGMYGAAQAIVHKATKYFNPEGYILDSQNEKLYNSILKTMHEKTISELRVMSFPDHKGDMQTFEYTVSRIEERSSTLNYCIVTQSLIQDPNKQDAQKLYDMITVNIRNISDILLGLALKSLQEQKYEEIPVSSKSIQNDILLFRFALSTEQDKILFRNHLQKDSKQITLEQYLSLPQEEQEKLKQEIIAQKKSSTIQSKKKRANNSSQDKNSSSQSPKGEQSSTNGQKKPEIESTRKKRGTSAAKSANNSPIKDNNSPTKTNNTLMVNNNKIRSGSKAPQNTPNTSCAINSQDLEKKLSASKELSKIPLQNTSQKLLDNDEQESLKLNATKKKVSDTSDEYKEYYETNDSDPTDEYDEISNEWDEYDEDDVFDEYDNNNQLIIPSIDDTTEEDEEQS